MDSKRAKVGLFMDRATNTGNRQTKTHVDKWISGSLLCCLWTMPKSIFAFELSLACQEQNKCIV